MVYCLLLGREKNNETVQVLLKKNNVSTSCVVALCECLEEHSWKFL